MAYCAAREAALERKVEELIGIEKQLRQQLDECRNVLDVWDALPEGHYIAKIIKKGMDCRVEVLNRHPASSVPERRVDEIKIDNHPGDICLICGYQRSYHSAALKDKNACDDFVKSKLED